MQILPSPLFAPLSSEVVSMSQENESAEKTSRERNIGAFPDPDAIQTIQTRTGYCYKHELHVVRLAVQVLFFHTPKLEQTIIFLPWLRTGSVWKPALS